MLQFIDVVNHFGLKYANGSPNSLKREIKRIQVDRPGLEISGFFKYHQKSKICLIGNKEIALMKTLSDEVINKNVKRIADEECPGIIFTSNNKVPEPFLNACREKDCPVYITSETTSNMMSQLILYLSEELAPRTSIHAELLKIYGKGVLILGDSGIGKSEACMALIKRGHILIADDKVNIKAVRGKLLGKAPEVLAGFMEIRGIGVINVEQMFGIHSYNDETEINYVINLIDFDKVEKIERLGITSEYYEILNRKLPIITLPVAPGRSMAELIEVAVTTLILKSQGRDSSFELEKRLTEVRDKGEYK